MAIPDVKEAVKDADILVFVVPHQFVKGICSQIKGLLKEGTIAVSLIKVNTSFALEIFVLNIMHIVLQNA